MRAKNYNDVKDMIHNREDFTHASCSGKWITDGWAVDRTDMNVADAGYLDILLARNGRVYVVKSYDTPIAFAAGDTIRIPAVYYSPTTSKHQNYLSLIHI